MPESEPQKPDNESKSQRKKDMLVLQKIGEDLIKLTKEQLATLDLPVNLLTAIQHMKSLTANEAKRRQLQYIGKIMRQVDIEAIKKALKNKKFNHKKDVEQFHHIEECRTKLLTYGDDAINLFMVEYPKADRQQLRQLVRNAQQDINTNKNTGAAKALFKYLRLLIEK